LIQANACQKCPASACVVAGAIGSGLGRVVIEAAHNLDVSLARLQRLKGAALWIVGTFDLRPPGLGNRAVGKEHEQGTQRRASDRGREACTIHLKWYCCPRGSRRGEQRHRQGDASSPQERAATLSVVVEGHGFSLAYGWAVG